MKVANFADGYTYGEPGKIELPDLGQKGPQPNNSMDKKKGNPLSLQGTIPAGWSHYEYAEQGHSGYGKKK